MRSSKRKKTIIEARGNLDASGTLPGELIDAIVGRIVEAVQPTHIILFGSASRGDLRDDSDLDLLVVMPEGIHRRQAARRIYCALVGIGRSRDIVVITENYVRQCADDPALVIHPALKEGKELYRAA